MTSTDNAGPAATDAANRLDPALLKLAGIVLVGTVAVHLDATIVQVEMVAVPRRGGPAAPAACSAPPDAWGRAGVAVVGSAFFSQLGTHSFTVSFEHRAPVAMVSFLAAAVLGLVLRRTAVAEVEEAL
jgi:hypothetical protein